MGGETQVRRMRRSAVEKLGAGLIRLMEDRGADWSAATRPPHPFLAVSLL